MHAREEAAVRRIRIWGRAQPIALVMNDFTFNDEASSASSATASEANFTRFSTSQLNIGRGSRFRDAGALPPDPELLRRARAAHLNADFSALAGGLEQDGMWQCVDTVDRFSVYRRQFAEAVSVGTPRTSASRLEVLCAGSLDASLDEVARILGPSSDAEHNASMAGLYAKNFIFGTIERKVKCHRYDDQEVVDGEQLAVKTSSFVHTTVFGHNEQWCYFHFFQRKSERDGFTISQHAIRPDESTPGRVKAGHAWVHQLHGLTALYLVDQLPGRTGLRVVFHSWFDPVQTTSSNNGRRRSLSDSTPHASSIGYCSEVKAQARRLLALARGVAQLPEYVRRRCFNVEVSTELNSPPIGNPRCPCCTCSLSAVKLTLATGLSAWKRLKKKRCYLCGYLVCGACWSAAQMESEAGRVASIVACTRCQARLETNRPAEFESPRDEALAIAASVSDP